MAFLDILVYNEVPMGELFITLFVVLGVFIIYVLRKLPIFDVLWGILVAIFIYALIGFLGKKIKGWFND